MGYAQLDGLSKIVAGVREKLCGTEGVNIEETMGFVFDTQFLSEVLERASQSHVLCTLC